MATLAWALPLGAGAACLGWVIRWIALSLRPVVHVNRVLVTGGLGLCIGLMAAAYQIVSDRSFTQVLFSGQDELPDVVAHAADYSVGVLLLLAACKTLVYGLSLSAFRGGPIFPAIFIGAVLGIAVSDLPGLAMAPAIGMGIGAMCAAMLRLPMTSALLAVAAPGGRRALHDARGDSRGRGGVRDHDDPPGPRRGSGRRRAGAPGQGHGLAFPCEQPGRHRRGRTGWLRVRPGRRPAGRRGHRRRHRRARWLRGPHRLRAQQDPDRDLRADDRGRRCRRAGRELPRPRGRRRDHRRASTSRRSTRRVKRLAAQQSADIAARLDREDVRVVRGRGRLDGPERVVVTTGRRRGADARRRRDPGRDRRRPSHAALRPARRRADPDLGAGLRHRRGAGEAGGGRLRRDRGGVRLGVPRPRRRRHPGLLARPGAARRGRGRRAGAGGRAHPPRHEGAVEVADAVGDPRAATP